MATNPYSHKLGDFGPEHFDGDPIDSEPTPARKAQHDSIVADIVGGIRAEQDRRKREQQARLQQQAAIAQNAIKNPVR